MTTTILPTRNAEWGFFGFIERYGLPYLNGLATRFAIMAELPD